jgi:hypothetical protein
MKQIPLLIVMAMGLSLCNLADRFKKAADSGSNSGSSSKNGSANSAPGPSPTSAQLAAIAGGQSVRWDQQEITWTLPQKWTKANAERNTFNWGGGNSAFLGVNISILGDTFPTDVATQAIYDQAMTRMKAGEVDEARWLSLDGVKGVQFREAKPEKPADLRRLQWEGYRRHAGQTQLVNVMLSAQAAEFDKQEDAFYGILYSPKISHQ